MTRVDNRSLDHKVLEHMRLLAVERVLAGEAPSAVAESLGIYRTSIYKWLRAHKKGGRAALQSTTAKGPKPKLSAAQKQQVRRWIVGKDPRPYGFGYGLWTRRIIAQMMLDKFAVSLTLPAVGPLLTSLDITPQKPLRRACERDEQAIRQWKEDKYPALRKRAKQRGAEICFLDEAGVCSDSPLGRSYGLKGQTPVVKTSGQRQKINALSAVNAKGAFWYNVYSGMLTAALFVVMLKDLLKGRKQPILLVVDGLSVHKAKLVAKYVQSTKGRVELHFLPPSAPDLNPDAFAWSHLKQNGTSKKPLRKNEALRQRVEEDLAAIKKDRSLVRSFFMAPSVSYASYLLVILQMWFSIGYDCRCERSCLFPPTGILLKDCCPPAGKPGPANVARCAGVGTSKERRDVVAPDLPACGGGLVLAPNDGARPGIGLGHPVRRGVAETVAGLGQLAGVPVLGPESPVGMAGRAGG